MRGICHESIQKSHNMETGCNADWARLMADNWHFGVSK